MTERNRFVDTLKGVFAIFVIMLHCPYETGVFNRFLFPFWVCMAVPGFMFISGYLSALSFDKKEMVGLKQAYAFRDICARLVRFILPYSVAFLLEWCVFRIAGLYQVNMITYGLRALFFEFLQGGKGPGNYYIPIMVQFVFLFPLIYLVIKKNKVKGLIGCFAANGLFEIIKTFAGMSDGVYRLLIFRYLFLIAAGVYLAVGEVKREKKESVWDTLSILVGLIFIVIFSYTGYQPKIFTMWAPTSLMTALYVVPIMSMLLRNCRKGLKPLETIGKASYEVFLVQMIYFCLGNKITETFENQYARLFISIIICTMLGIAFFYAINPLTTFLMKKIRK